MPSCVVYKHPYCCVQTSALFVQTLGVFDPKDGIVMYKLCDSLYITMYTTGEVKLVAASEKRKLYLKEYRLKKLRRVPLDVTPELYWQIKAAADAEEKSVNEWIRRAIVVQLLRKK